MSKIKFWVEVRGLGRPLEQVGAVARKVVQVLKDTSMLGIKKEEEVFVILLPSLPKSQNFDECFHIKINGLSSLSGLLPSFNEELEQKISKEMTTGLIFSAKTYCEIG